MKLLILTIFFIFMLPEPAFSQEVSGKIITSQEAENLFGLPDKEYKIPSASLKDFTGLSGYLYFNFSGSGVLIFDSKKEPLYPAEYKSEGNEVFTVYSSTVVNELLQSAESEYVTVQLRKNVLTISNGNHILEYGMICPPYCY